MSFTNLYYKRAVGTAKACYICNKPTTTVLATIKAVDFIYVCDSHLTDPGFATQMGESNDDVGPGGAKKLGLSPEEIAKVKEEWEERQRRKQAKEKEKEKEKEREKEKEKGKDPGKDNKSVAGPGDKDKESKQDKVLESDSPSQTTTNTPISPTHQRYSLHRDIFAMRLAEHRKRRQIAQAKELAPRLPSAPRGPLPSSLS